MRISILFFMAAIVLGACGNKKKTSPQENYKIEGDTIILPANSNINGKIKTFKIIKELFSKTIHSPAIIEGNPTRMSKITPPLAGRILKINVQMGQNVKVGEILFSMDAPEFVDAQKNFLSTKQELLKAKIKFNREKDLMDHGVGVKKDFEEARGDLNIRKSEFENAIGRLKLYGINNYETMAIGDPLKIKAPVSGRVSGIEMTIGQFKNDLSEVLMIVADLSEVWITANVKEKDIRNVNSGDSTTAQVLAYPGKVYKGKILFVDDILNEETHALKVRIQMPNPERELKPGMFASITFIDKPTPSVLIPSTALLQKENKSIVFIEIAPEKYKKRIVESSESSNGKTLIVEGLKEGEIIVSEGGFYLLNAK